MPTFNNKTTSDFQQAITSITTAWLTHSKNKLTFKLNPMSNNLFDNIKLGDIALKNRIVMAPLTRSRANNEQHKATQLIAEYYAQRATAGLIISEGSQISKNGCGLY